MEKQIRELAQRVFGMKDDEVNSLFKKTADDKLEMSDDAVDILSRKHRSRIDDIQSDHRNQLTEIHDKGYKKAQKEAMEKFEQQLKQKYSVDSDKYGADLVDEILSKKSEGKIEDVKTHPDYVALEKKLQSDFVPKNKLEEIQNEFNSFKQGVERSNTLNKVKEDARNIFRSLNPILSKDQKRAANQESDFLNKLESFDYQVRENGDHLIIKDGKRLENENYNPVNFAEFVKSKASDYFDFSDQQVRGNSGISDSGGSGSSIAFKDKGEFLKALNAEQDPEKRVKIYHAAAEQGLVSKPGQQQ